jgi:hypothetical protein
MHLRSTFKSITALAALCVFGSFAQADEPKLEPIFNGHDLTGWTIPKEPFWKAVDGVLVGESPDDKQPGSMLYTEKSYHDVIVEAECRWSGEIDSGIMVRKPEIQLQIGVSRSLKKDMSGSFYVGKYPEEGQAKNADKLIKIGEWTKFRLQAKGDTYTVWINGEKAVEYKDPKYVGAAPIGLQIHPKVKMKVEFRNIKAVALD